MSNFIVLGDLHIGAKSASPIMAEHQLLFFEEQMFPYMKKHGITTILQLGDTFDTRKFSNHVILHKWRARFFDYLENNNIEFHTILGNHDAAAKNTLEINAPSIFLNEYKSVFIIDRPTHRTLEGIQFLLVPWICDDNRGMVEKMVAGSSALYCSGHFEFDGFFMHKGTESHGGEDTNKYSHFDLVLSGHYHTKSKKKNIQYTGTPYELTWADFGDQKGFYVFNTTKHKLSFVKNIKPIFHRITYDDKDTDQTVVVGLENSYIKILVANKTDPYKFEKYVEGILAQSPADLKIVDLDTTIEGAEIDDTIDLANTKELIENFVENVETSLDKKKIQRMMDSLYIAALDVID